MHPTLRILLLFALSACTSGGSDTNDSAAASDTAAATLPPVPPAADSATVAFRAVGQEPGWLLSIGDSLALRWDYDERRITVPAPSVESSGGERRYRFTSGDTSFVIVVRDSLCSDVMSGHRYPSHVDVTIGSRTLRGCGGEPAQLLRDGTWSVVSLDGQPLVAGSTVTMEFGVDGRVSGSAGCNRFSGPFDASWNSLTIRETVSTRMACTPEIDRQETQFLSRINGTMQFYIDSDGVLHLTRDNTDAITARRQ